MSTKNSSRDELDKLCEEFDFSRMKHGKEALKVRQERLLKAAAKKGRITIRLDLDILETFKELAGDGAYQSLINSALRDWLAARSVKELLEKELPNLIAKHSATQKEQTVQI